MDDEGKHKTSKYIPWLIETLKEMSEIPSVGQGQKHKKQSENGNGKGAIGTQDGKSMKKGKGKHKSKDKGKAKTNRPHPKAKASTKAETNTRKDKAKQRVRAKERTTTQLDQTQIHTMHMSHIASGFRSTNHDSSWRQRRNLRSAVWRSTMYTTVEHSGAEKHSNRS